MELSPLKISAKAISFTMLSVLIKYQMFIEERYSMQSVSPSMANPLSVVPTIPTSPKEDGLEHRISNRETHLSIHPKQCEWCEKEFMPRTKKEEREKRFCNQSCSAKWRMNQPEHLAKVHTPEVAKKRGQKRREWFASGNPKAEAERDRIRALNPMSDPKVREKSSRRLKEIQHKPSVHGGNGMGLTPPQQILLDVLGDEWIAEYALSLGPRTQGYPTCYKIDIANPKRKIAVEVDGHSHRSRKAQDQKKDEKLASLGWTVLRFWNWDILTWKDSGMPMDMSISMTLAQHNIPLLA